MTSVTDPEGNVTQYQYCSAATPVCASPDPAGGGYLQRKILDAANSPRRTEPTPPAQITTQLLYDEWGNVIQSIDGRGNTTSFTVNQLNQVVATRSAAPYNYMTLTYYDANDNIAMFRTR
jgi:YD repeat-containing protein